MRTAEANSANASITDPTEIPPWLNTSIFEPSQPSAGSSISMITFVVLMSARLITYVPANMLAACEVNVGFTRWDSSRFPLTHASLCLRYCAARWQNTEHIFFNSSDDVNRLPLIAERFIESPKRLARPSMMARTTEKRLGIRVGVVSVHSIRFKSSLINEVR